MVADEPEDEIKVEIELQEERYFVGERVSQVVNSNVNQVLASIWDKPGFFKIERSINESQVTHIEDNTGVLGNDQCTDLIGIRTQSEDTASYIQYFIARTQSAVNIIDTVKEKMYCLQ